MFIRTKDGVFEVKSHNKNCGIYEVFAKDIDYQTFNTLVAEESIIAKSEDPVELCDGFYIDVEGRSFNCIWVYNDINSCKKAAKLLEKNVIRGFIKTDNSLNFVCEVKND